MFDCAVRYVREVEQASGQALECGCKAFARAFWRRSAPELEAKKPLVAILPCTTDTAADGCSGVRVETDYFSPEAAGTGFGSSGADAAAGPP